MLHIKASVVFGVAFQLLLLAANAKADQIIVNGDFEQGNTGFASQYVYSPSDIGPVQTYAVVHSPGDARPHDHNGAALHDHTTGTGLLFAGNGAAIPNVVAWSETVAVVPHSTYDFALWDASWFPSSPATFNILFNGISIGTPAAPPSVNPWVEFTASWNSGSDSSLTINIIDTNLADVGSDFALDDISLNGPSPGGPSPTPEPSTMVLALGMAIGLGGIALWKRNRKRFASDL